MIANHVVIGTVVTELTEARATRNWLRALKHRVCWMPSESYWPDL